MEHNILLKRKLLKSKGRPRPYIFGQRYSQWWNTELWPEQMMSSEILLPWSMSKLR